MPLEFFCECSNPQCTERIKLTHNQYEALHKTRTQFVLKPGHELPQVEKVIKREQKYILVDKFVTPPQATSALKPV